MQEFFRFGFDDSYLPFKRKGLELSSIHRNNRMLTCITTWSADIIQQFSREQWSFLAPVFDHSSLEKHWVFDKRLILPFISDTSLFFDQIQNGGTAEVFKVNIHPAHNFSKASLRSFSKVR
jgi:hypothetical protein